MTAILDHFSLSGKVAIVTGASTGLGVDISVGLAEAGAAVGICARREDLLAETRAKVEQHQRCVAARVDVTSPADCDRFARSVLDELGAVDILVNNAGVATAVPATRETPEEFRRVLAINLEGSYFMAQACGRLMKPGSSIINISSVLALTTAGLPQAAYASSKAGVIGMTRDLAQQWTGRKGIRVNALAPGFFETEMTDQYPDGYVERLLTRVPADRKGDARELVLATIFLASDASTYVTGAVLPVDGGLLLT